MPLFSLLLFIFQYLFSMEELFSKHVFILKYSLFLPIAILFHSNENKNLSGTMIVAYKKISEVEIQLTSKKVDVTIMFPAHLGTVISAWDGFVQQLAQS